MTTGFSRAGTGNWPAPQRDKQPVGHIGVGLIDLVDEHYGVRLVRRAEVAVRVERFPQNALHDVFGVSYGRRTWLPGLASDNFLTVFESPEEVLDSRRRRDDLFVVTRFEVPGQVRGKRRLTGTRLTPKEQRTARGQGYIDRKPHPGVHPVDRPVPAVKKLLVIAALPPQVLVVSELARYRAVYKVRLVAGLPWRPSIEIVNVNRVK